jgi:acetylornithine deacetylase/succinyl-diaminopimelate desuccinylase-like protein
MNDGSITHRSALIQGEDDVVRLARDLIRIDTSNPTADERKAAEYVAAELSSLGLEPTIVEAEPGRASVIARWAGTEPDADALLCSSPSRCRSGKPGRLESAAVRR